MHDCAECCAIDPSHACTPLGSSYISLCTLWSVIIVNWMISIWVLVHLSMVLG